MRRTALFALMITLIMLTACTVGRHNEEIFQKTSESFQAAAEISFTASVRASYGDKILDYTLDCTWVDAQTQISVVSPRLISGVTATVTDGGSRLCFDGLVLDPPDAIGGGISPLTAPAFIINALRAGHVSSVGKDKLGELDVIAVSVLDAADNPQTILIDAVSALPVSAELYSGGAVAITCEFTGWQLKGS